MPSRTIAIYYGLTPAFFLADWGFGVNLRAAALEDQPFWRVVYYLFCVACGLLIWKRPDWTVEIGRFEATLNISLIVLAILVPYYRLIDELAAGASTIDAAPFAPMRIASLVLSGLVWAATFYVPSETPGGRSR